jgi:hypothetical protein
MRPKCSSGAMDFFGPFIVSPCKPPGRHLVPRSAHILPFSFHNKVCVVALCSISVHHKLFDNQKDLTLKALETFTGRPLADEVITTSTILAMHSMRNQTPTKVMVNWHGVPNRSKRAIR